MINKIDEKIKKNLERIGMDYKNLIRNWYNKATNQRISSLKKPQYLHFNVMIK